LRRDYHPGIILDMDLVIFSGTSLVAYGPAREALRLAHAHPAAQAHHGAPGALAPGAPAPLLAFDLETGRQVDLDLRGDLDTMLDREAPRPGPGRPRLGVVAREVTLLPRHWEWLERQRGGASAALRRLVEQELRRDPAGEEARRTREATARVLTPVAGDLPGFEEAMRALYAGDTERLHAHTADWPEDVRTVMERMLS
jgi:hypothetical protein